MERLLWYPGHEHLMTGIVRGEGNHVYDAEGKRYLDLESGVWAASLGHAHPRLLKILADQAAKIMHNGFCWSSPIVDEAAGELLSLLGFDGGRCVFLSSGSDAVEYGVRVTRMLSDRPLFLTMTDSYFGAYGSAAARPKDEWVEFDWFPCAKCDHADVCDSTCARLADIPFDRVGGFLLEPGSSSGLVRFPPVGLVREIARRIQQRGGWFIVNEVTTGIGRTGRWFGFQHYEVEPDIIATGKGIGGGYPVSATIFSRRAAERLGDRAVKYAQSHQNDPLGAAVLRDVIRIIRDEGLIEHAMRMGQLLREGLDGLRSRCARVRDVRSRGLMAAVDLEDDLDCTFTIRVHHALVDRGFIVGRRPGVPVLRIDPCLTIGREQIGEFLGSFEEVLRNASA
jgi:acetylornithine/N-succinyldiaminopimelate aminotransferase